MIHWMLILTLLSENPGGAPGDNFLGTHKKNHAAGAFFSGIIRQKKLRPP